MSPLFIFLIALIPAFLWAFYFYKMNPRPQSLGEIVKILLLGFFSVAPVALYHLYVVPFIRESFQLLFNFSLHPFVEAMITLVSVLVFIFVFIWIFALLQTLALKIFYHMPLAENFRSVYKRMYNLMPMIPFFVLFVAGEIIGEKFLGTPFIVSILGTTILFAVMEEYFKFIINPFLVFKKLNSIGGAIINAMYVGLAFSFIENILFFIQNQGTEGFAVVYFYRSLITTLLHVCTSGILGYFYGASLFGKALVREYEIERSRYDTFEKLRHFLNLRKKNVFQSVSITQGFFAAAVLHSIFNVLLLMGWVLPAAIIVVSFSIFMMTLLQSEHAQTQYGLIGTPEMPEGDFEALRLKISVMDHLKEIRAQQAQQKIPPHST